MKESIWAAIISAMGTVVAALVNVFVGQSPKRPKGESYSETTKDCIVRVYDAVFERYPDRDGLANYAGQLQRGEKSVQEIVREIGKSEDYYDHFVRGFPPREAVNLLYRHFLGREPESEEIVDEHIEVLNSKGWKHIVDKLVDSKEYLKKFGKDSPPARSA